MTRIPLWHLALVASLCILTYSNTLSGAYLWDDEIQVIKNPNIRSLSNIPSAFSQSAWEFTNAGTPAEANQSNYYRPTQLILYALSYWWSPLDPFPNHVINIGLHTIATLFVYLICLELAIPLGFCLLAAALFAVHPIHTEAVAWIAATPESACGACFFASFWAYLRSRDGTIKTWLYLSALLWLPALFSKEMAITLPPLILLTTLRPGPQPQKIQPWTLSRRAQLMLPFLPALGIYLALRINALGFLATTHTSLVMGYFDWFTLGLYAFGNYIWYAVLPCPLIAYHQIPMHLADRVTPTLLALLPIAVASTLTWIARKRFPAIPVWFAAFALMLVPVFYLKGISLAVIAERYLYIPSLAVVIIFVLVLAALPKQALWAGWMLVLAFATAAILRNRDWRDAERLYAVTLERDPDVANLQINLAEKLLARGDDTNAVRYLDRALAVMNSELYVTIPGDYYRTHIGLGAILARAKQFSAAREHLETARKINPIGDWPYLYLGGISMEADNDIPAAIEHLKTAIRLGPLNEVARDYLGVAYFNQGRLAEAKAEFVEALRLNPTHGEARTHLDAVNAALGQAQP